MRTIHERFEEKVYKAPDGCWLWLAHCNAAGYGKFGVCGKVVLAHRYSYEAHVGTIPEGLHLDHLCRMRNCVNPAHLEPVTFQENIRRGIGAQSTRERHAKVTHCPAGHPYAPDNITPQILKGRWTARCCKTCKREKAIARYYANRHEINLRRSARCSTGQQK